MPTAWTSDLVSDALRRRLQFALIVVMSLCIARHAWLARYSHPMADDFFYAHKDVSHGAASAAKWEYAHWNGRYTSNFLVLYGPLRCGLDHIAIHRLIPVLLLALTLLGTFVLLATLFRPFLSRSEVATASLVWTALYLHAMPDLAEGFYWYTAAVTYQLANVLALLHLALLARLRRAPSTWLTAVTALLLFLLIGFNEVMMALLVVTHLLLVLFHWRRGKRRVVWPWTLLAISIAGAVLMLMAPGNEARSTFFPDQHKLVHSLVMSLSQTARFGLVWLSSPAVLGSAALYILAHDRLSIRVPAIGTGFGLKPWMTLLAIPTVLFLCVFPAYWSTGILGQYRTVNVACFFLLPLGFLHLSVWLTHSGSRPWAFRLRSGHALVIATVLACTGLLFLRNGHRANMDILTGRAWRSDRQLWQRYALLDAAPDGSVITVPPVIDPPKSIYVLDIRPDPRFLQNTDYALWFGLKEVRLADQSEAAKAIN